MNSQVYNAILLFALVQHIHGVRFDFLDWIEPAEDPLCKNFTQNSHLLDDCFSRTLRLRRCGFWFRGFGNREPTLRSPTLEHSRFGSWQRRELPR
ncbi:hypothetical protein MTP99_011703 [Tenebrio molitor]|nr:hypothetical protein MTP99_011703 [Tenebrio molitor]